MLPTVPEHTLRSVFRVPIDSWRLRLGVVAAAYHVWRLFSVSRTWNCASVLVALLFDVSPASYVYLAERKDGIGCTGLIHESVLWGRSSTRCFRGGGCRAACGSLSHDLGQRCVLCSPLFLLFCGAQHHSKISLTINLCLQGDSSDGDAPVEQVSRREDGAGCWL